SGAVAAALAARAPSAWARVAGELARVIPPAEIDGIWVFRPIRQDQREWGTAVVARIDGERRRIYTARYVLVIKGRERGQFSAVIEEVGSGPVEAVAELVAGVQQRMDDEVATPAPVEEWFPPAPGDAAAPSGSGDGAPRHG
ncbi:MAG TPA: hypothetical protein VNK43_12315, partial [Gemmatimonadales bacterium]|nr:hypothetical protein [Gemmatimonadales bacterium]